MVHSLTLVITHAHYHSPFLFAFGFATNVNDTIRSMHNGVARMTDSPRHRMGTHLEAAKQPRIDTKCHDNTLLTCIVHGSAENFRVHMHFFSHFQLYILYEIQLLFCLGTGVPRHSAGGVGTFLRAWYVSFTMRMRE